ncbi:hypothetical protein FPSM_01592 [Flavobacterium psychrophilum]|nr:hypothetical protein FPSM_01592 [Flavobacterium psychrophilum]
MGWHILFKIESLFLHLKTKIKQIVWDYFLPY